MANPDMALMAHLMRRAGFGATHEELEECAAKGYEAVVEELVQAADPQSMPDDIIRRCHPDQSEMLTADNVTAYWMYKMVTTRCPLQEKMALFWHGFFATGYAKVDHAKTQFNQAQMFRRHGLGSFRTLLIELSRDPAMIMWLDNNDNHNGAINENYGRELLELFSMGIGNYTEEDVRECARAFTGWTLANEKYMVVRAHKSSIWPYSRIAWHFEYRDDDHDHGEKTFLDETGRFNGEDIIDIVARQEATARFVSSRLFQFFAADEIDEDGERVVDDMASSYFDSGYEIRSVLRTLFRSDYFKSQGARFARVRGPVELIVNTAKISGGYRTPTPDVHQLGPLTLFMGQGVLRPPTVEGWHEGTEWIDSGTLVERVNFAANELGDVRKPGVRAIIDRLASEEGGVLTPERLVDRCLSLTGLFDVSDETHSGLVASEERRGNLDLRGHQQADEAEQRVAHALSMVASTREFQLA